MESYPQNKCTSYEVYFYTRGWHGVDNVPLAVHTPGLAILNLSVYISDIIIIIM